ncbi:stealth conserved region 3 domain-containing protein [Neorhizobium sp. AL 9.2.2]|uniref:stealth conserved region 3 domain-containing protein n=1 Tax=Neorhizobium sp. AL 9.2.2 TaxID=2712894 RepID=UPI001571B2F4|nr:stealth conserved region 3 domain-containing protein [Neorhizobium sp. AL 9.2.2]NSY19987.1 hypothetical protein [Neorhizobium sp. AL 9.2.2]
MLKNIPHPGVALRNYLNSRYPLTPTKLTAMAQAINLDIGGDASLHSGNTRGKIAHIAQVAPGPKCERTLALITKALRSLEIPFFLGGGTAHGEITINILQQDIWAFLAAIQQWLSIDPDVLIETQARKPVRVTKLGSMFGTTPPEMLRIFCVENYGGERKELIAACSYITINVWAAVTNYSGDTIYESGLTTPYAKRLRHKTIDAFLKNKASFESCSLDVMSTPKFPIDIVYTWVNDQDEDWNNQRVARAVEVHKSVRAHNLERWKNRDELRFSLRSVAMFAPWVRNIFIVTSGQIPDWLNDTNPRVKIVPHAEIWKNPESLPTFNSSGIETQLHHIKDLSEHFLYFNDDFFLGSFCTPDDFFLPNGVMKYFPSDQRVFEPDIDETSEEYIFADFNAINLLKEKYGQYGREIMQHIPYPSRKSLLERLESEFQSAFDRCAGEPFRSRNDIRPIAFLQYHAGLQEGLAVPSGISHRYLALWKPAIAKQFSGVASTRRYKTFCINDVGVTIERQNEVDKLVVDFLEVYYPFKSEFEK